MSQPNRLVYTKKRTTKRKKPRLHGAFKGGFSAGHFNTVGSTRGWTPSDEGIDEEQTLSNINHDQDNVNVNGENEDYHSKPGWRSKGRKGDRLSSKSKDKKSRKQKVEDYMDDEDANEWGGPLGVRKDYLDLDSASNQQKKSSKSNGASESIKEMLSVNVINADNGSIGKQLLRVLGWREKAHDSQDDIHKSSGQDQGRISYLYIPLEDDENTGQTNKFLASKRLKRIELKLSKHEKKALPRPKNDTYGLGFEPFENAPEFKAFKELRKKRAEMRAMAATSSHGDNRMNVYRTSALSSLYGDADADEDADDDFETSRRRGRDFQEAKGKGMTNANVKPNSNHGQHADKGGNGDILTYETTEDFIGSKTASGFALHDDADDVYDELFSSDRGNIINEKAPKRKIDTEGYHNEIYEASDSDTDGDDPKIHGDKINAFAGALSAWATNDLKSGKRENVVAMTSDGRPPLEGFHLSSSDSKSAVTRFPGPALPKNFEVKKHIFPEINAIDQMKTLSSNMRMQMSSRRRAINSEHKISSIPPTTAQRDTKPMAGGSFAELSSSLKDRFTTSNKEHDEEKDKGICLPLDPSKINPQRTVFEWQPSILLCKRLGVSVPRMSNINSKPSQLQATKPMESREEKFFRQEVLIKKTGSATNRKKMHDAIDDKLAEDQFDINRPTMEYMKSIFEPVSDDNMSISEDDESANDEEESVSKNASVIMNKESVAIQPKGEPDEETNGIDIDTGEINAVHVPQSSATALGSAIHNEGKHKRNGAEDGRTRMSSESNSDDERRHRRRHRTEKKNRKHKKDRKKYGRKKSKSRRHH